MPTNVEVIFFFWEGGMTPGWVGGFETFLGVPRSGLKMEGGIGEKKKISRFQIIRGWHLWSF